MKVSDIKKHAMEQGCSIVEEKPFSLVASCAGGRVFIVKNPESRIKVLVNSNLVESISSMIGNVPGVVPKEITVGNFSKQGEWSRMIKLDNLDKVEFLFGEAELDKSQDETIKKAMRRIKRANTISSLEYGENVEPFKIIRDEVNKISNFLATNIEESIAPKVDENIICASSTFFQKAWNQVESEKYHFSISVNCNIPPLMKKVSKAVERIGNWKTMSESDALFIKSVVSPTRDSFLTGIKIKSPYGEKQFEFELMSEDELKKGDVVKNFEEMSKKESEPISEEPLNIEDLIPAFIKK